MILYSDLRIGDRIRYTFNGLRNFFGVITALDDKHTYMPIEVTCVGSAVRYRIHLCEIQEVLPH